MTIEIIEGDCRDVLRELPDQSVNCIVTSPPYFGLRDYGTASWVGGDPACSHRPDDTPEQRGIASSTLGGGKNHTGHKQEGFKVSRPKCGAKRVDSQIGLEPTPDEFVAALVGVMREARRVLRDDGTLWLNLGDSYASAWAMPGGRRNIAGQGSLEDGRRENRPNRLVGGLKEKDLIGIPWMAAFALRADGWYLRQDIIWHKPNPMPESVTDRCTKAHEYIFLFSKKPKYYYDADAVKEPAVQAGRVRTDPVGGKSHVERGQHSPGGVFDTTKGRGGKSAFRGQGHMREGAGPANREGRDMTDVGVGEFRNRRDVWTVTTKPFRGAHFATFPPDLIEPCVLAGCPEGGTVLDPFFGAGTIGLVCQRTGRNAIGIELNPAYYDIAAKRLWPEDAA